MNNVKEQENNERARKRERGEEGAHVLPLPEKKRGWHVLLGERLDEFVQKYVLKVQERGGAVNTTLVMACAKGIVESLDRTRLVEYGGDITSYHFVGTISFEEDELYKT